MIWNKSVILIEKGVNMRDFELKTNAESYEGGKISIITKTHTIIIHTKYLDDSYYLASNLEDCADEIEVKEN